jgi:hypothetical protein
MSLHPAFTRILKRAGAVYGRRRLLLACKHFLLKAMKMKLTGLPGKVLNGFKIILIPLLKKLYSEVDVMRLLDKLFWDLRNSGGEHLTRDKKLSGRWWYNWFQTNKKQKDECTSTMHPR